MAGRLLACVRAGKRKVGYLVTDGPSKLFEARPVREYPDHVRSVWREGPLEAVAQPGNGRGYDRIDEGDFRLLHVELEACLRKRAQCRLDVNGVRVGHSHLIRLDVHAQPREP